MTSAGILVFVDDLHGMVDRMRDEVDDSTVLGQSFIGPWTDYIHTTPFDDTPPVRGVLDLIAKIRSPTHIINTTADFQRLNRYNKRLQAHWDDGVKRGQKWTEPRPDDRSPGSSEGGGLTLDKALGGATTLLLLVAAVWLLKDRR
jgi:hypothetical protein